jgi:hypothetical protein
MMFSNRRLLVLGAFALLVVALFAAFAFVSQPVNSALAQDDPDGGDMQDWFEWAVDNAADDDFLIYIDWKREHFELDGLQPLVGARNAWEADDFAYIGSEFVCIEYENDVNAGMVCIPYHNINEFGLYREN